jgi:hypothetical protein
MRETSREVREQVQQNRRADLRCSHRFLLSKNVGQGLSAAEYSRQARFRFSLRLAPQVRLNSPSKQFRHRRASLARQFVEPFEQCLRQPNGSAFLHAPIMYVKVCQVKNALAQKINMRNWQVRCSLNVRRIGARFSRDLTRILQAGLDRAQIRILGRYCSREAMSFE